MTAPVRLRLSRARGFDLKAHSLAINGLPAVNVARPGPWGNPFVVGVEGTRETCVWLHRKILAGGTCLTCKTPIDAQRSAERYACDHIAELTGKNLACWCALDGKPCHADTLLKIAREFFDGEVKP